MPIEADGAVARRFRNKCFPGPPPRRASTFTMATSRNPDVPREKSLIDVEVLDFGPLYHQAVEYYISQRPERGTWSKEKRDRLIIRTECRWGRINLDREAVYVLSESGEGPKAPLSASTRAYVSLYAEMPPQDGDPGFFDAAPFCKVPIDLKLATTLRSIGIVALEDFIRTKIPEMEAAYEEWRATLLEARAKILAARARRGESAAMPVPQRQRA